MRKYSILLMCCLCSVLALNACDTSSGLSDKSTDQTAITHKLGLMLNQIKDAAGLDSPSLGNTHLEANKALQIAGKVFSTIMQHKKKQDWEDEVLAEFDSLHEELSEIESQIEEIESELEKEIHQSLWQELNADLSDTYADIMTLWDDYVGLIADVASDSISVEAAQAKVQDIMGKIQSGNDPETSINTIYLTITGDANLLNACVQVIIDGFTGTYGDDADGQVTDAATGYRDAYTYILSYQIKALLIICDYYNQYNDELTPTEVNTEIAKIEKQTPVYFSQADWLVTQVARGDVSVDGNDSPSFQLLDTLVKNLFQYEELLVFRFLFSDESLSNDPVAAEQGISGVENALGACNGENLYTDCTRYYDFFAEESREILFYLTDSQGVDHNPSEDLSGVTNVTLHSLWGTNTFSATIRRYVFTGVTGTLKYYEEDYNDKYGIDDTGFPISEISPDNWPGDNPVFPLVNDSAVQFDSPGEEEHVRSLTSRAYTSDFMYNKPLKDGSHYKFVAYAGQNPPMVGSKNFWSTYHLYVNFWYEDNNNGRFWLDIENSDYLYSYNKAIMATNGYLHEDSWSWKDEERYVKKTDSGSHMSLDKKKDDADTFTFVKKYLTPAGHFLDNDAIRPQDIFAMTWSWNDHETWIKDNYDDWGDWDTYSFLDNVKESADDEGKGQFSRRSYLSLQ